MGGVNADISPEDSANGLLKHFESLSEEQQLASKKIRLSFD